MRQPRLSAVIDCENRLRRDWQAFVESWQRTSESWRDKRRQEFENNYLKELPPCLSHVQSELNHFRETLERAMRTLADNETQP